MTTASPQVTEFYHQLGLLIKSRLPLPDSLRELSAHLPSPAFRDALLRVSEMTANGARFSDAVRAYPRFFDPVHAQMIAAGESAGTLADTLFCLARFAASGISWSPA